MGKRNAISTTTCPCGRALSLAQCCGRYHAGEPAPDAEALMRSRYSAFALGREDYLLATWHADTRPPSLELDAGPKAVWIGLEVKRHAVTGEHAAEVEFVARCRVGGRAQRMHETSRFLQEGGRWFYVDGDQHSG